MIKIKLLSGAEMHSRVRLYCLVLILSLATSAFGIQPVQESQKEVHINQFNLLDKTSGWILLGSQLFWTSDLGQTWKEIGPSIPSNVTIQDVEFIDFNTGWILWTTNDVNGNARFTLVQTIDHGIKWRERTLPLFEAGEIQAHSDESSFGWFDAQSGWIAVKQSTSSNFSLGTLFTTSDGGKTWVRSALPVADRVTFSDSKTGWAVGNMDRNQIFKTQDGGNSWQKTERDILHASPMRTSNLPGSITVLDMVSVDVGWAKWVDAKCTTASSHDDGPASVSCTSHTRLLRTIDGGLTWQAVQLPLVGVDITSSSHSLEVTQQITVNAAPAEGNTELLTGQGFDKCEIPSSSQLQTWWNNGPYKAVNLYIGGISRACSNSALTSSYLEQLYQQGWRFIPTWVGPQAPCTGFTSRMSSDPVTAYNQGVNEANLAVEQLAQLGLTFPDKTGSVVYYDIEYYGTDTACRNAVNSFINGWVSQIHTRGNLAGVYGSTLCDTGLSDFLTIPNVPDAIWPARWYHNLGQGYYDPDATVWNLGSCIPNTVWADHQRIRQYEGDHNETWGDLTLNIDSNAMDGVVAIPYTFPYVTSITLADVNPTFDNEVDFTVTFSDNVTDVDISDFVLNTTGMTDASIINVSGSGNLYKVTINTGTANGTIRLDVPDTAVINDIYGQTISDVAFKGGETYMVYKTMAIFTSTKGYDGWVLESSETSNLGGTKNKSGAILKLGDNVDNKQFRSFLSFNTSPMPDNAVITSATLKIKYAGVKGTNPFTTNGELWVDVCKGAFKGNPVLQLSDFNALASKSKVLTFMEDMVDNWFSQSLNPIDLPYINLTGVTQFRLRFSKGDNNDYNADFLKIYSGNALLEEDRPQLIVEFYTP